MYVTFKINIPRKNTFKKIFTQKCARNESLAFKKNVIRWDDFRYAKKIINIPKGHLICFVFYYLNYAFKNLPENAFYVN